ncbi:hypothetical protein ACBI99_44645 [Nonomuraea sp. ATR24]|uniref:hypothetical protein n=1 Tax=Nonomuraea sp. ATR24 TaxID=1676744 RepID=UPI0035BF9A4A
MADVYGSGLEHMLQDLIRRVQKLEAGQRGGPGLTVGQASGAFLLPATTTPAAPDNGAYLYADFAGTVRWRGPSGEGAVGGLSGIPAVTWSLFNPPATYDQAHIQTIINTLESLQASYTALYNALT